MQSLILTAVHYILQILSWLIIADVVLTWIPQAPQHHPAVVLLRKITRPITDIFRKIIPPQRMGDAYLDLSPLLAIIAIYIADRFVFNLILKSAQTISLQMLMFIPLFLMIACRYDDRN